MELKCKKANCLECDILMTNFLINTLDNLKFLCNTCKKSPPEWAIRHLGKSAKGYVKGSDNPCTGHRMTEFDRQLLNYNKRRQG